MAGEDEGEEMISAHDQNMYWAAARFAALRDGRTSNEPSSSWWQRIKCLFNPHSKS